LPYTNKHLRCSNSGGWVLGRKVCNVTCLEKKTAITEVTAALLFF
jgi:hypothetical protein